ncbi:hypothetical protein E2C01_030089 [Portunus trituberculatus]|uniref:Uncharacterized protein n=1 Tax=Portunus trituberculatus TaxID=210409 RepID=A0A5B7ETA8_PORTR|nr:hypothetical protein [Portunus trituberculatus]
MWGHYEKRMLGAQYAVGDLTVARIQTQALGDPLDPKARMAPLYHGGPGYEHIRYLDSLFGGMLSPRMRVTVLTIPKNVEGTPSSCVSSSAIVTVTLVTLKACVLYQRDYRGATHTSECTACRGGCRKAGSLESLGIGGDGRMLPPSTSRRELADSSERRCKARRDEARQGEARRGKTSPDYMTNETVVLFGHPAPETPSAL